MKGHTDYYTSALDVWLSEACDQIFKALYDANERYREDDEREMQLGEELEGFLQCEGACFLTAEQHKQISELVLLMRNTSYMQVKYAYLMGMKDTYVIPKLVLEIEL